MAHKTEIEILEQSFKAKISPIQEKPVKNPIIKINNFIMLKIQ